MEIQNECSAIEKKVTDAKEFGTDIDERLNKLLEPTLKDLKEKYAFKNNLIDDCDNVFDKNEALVNDIEEKLAKELENVNEIL